MKIILLSLLLLLLTAFEINAQNCKTPCLYYNNFVKMAQANTVENTQTKLNYYRAAIVAARDCHCPELEESAYDKIDTLFIRIEADKRKAEAQSKIILEQQEKVKTALTEAEVANEKNVRIINAMDFYDGKFALAFKDDKYGFIDKDGNPKFGFIYDKGEPFDPSTGFAEMERATFFDRTKYLIDTSGNRYRLINIPEVLREEGFVKSVLSKEDITFLKKKLTSSTEEKNILAKLEQIESREGLANKELVDVMKKDKEKLALDFADLAKEDVLSVLLHLSKERKIKDRVELLLFDGDDLDTFPSAIIEFKNLKEIDISGTEIRSIPDTIDKLTYLKMLRLPSTVKEVPFSFYNLENLERLSLFNTAYQILPEDIGKLKNLKELSLPRESREIPSNVYDLEELEELTLLYTWIREVSEDIGKLKNLKKLSLPRGLRKVPSSVYRLEKLKSLFLCATDEKEIPKEIENLKNLEYLNINMPIEELPTSICKLESLKNLRLYDAELIMLPESIGDLITLEQLYLPKTIEKIPASLYNLENLKALSIPGVAMNELPEGIGQLTNLERLDLSETWIKVLPDGFDKLIKLKNLRLPRSLEKLPNGFDKLVNLENLYIEENHGLKHFPDLSNFTKLTYFSYTLHKDEYYDANIEIWRALEEKLPNCAFQIKDIEGDYIFLPGEGELDLDDLDLDDIDWDDLELPSMAEIEKEVRVEMREEKRKLRKTKREEKRAARKNKKK